MGVDAGLASREVAVGLDGIHGAALVGVDPVETYRGRKQYRSLGKVIGSKNYWKMG